MTFNLDQMELEIVEPIEDDDCFLKIHNKYYYFKTIKISDETYNELIAAKIAERLAIPHASYYLGTYHGQQGVLSELIDMKNFISFYDFITEILKVKKEKPSDVQLINSYHELENILYVESFHNLEDIWFFLSEKYDAKTVEKVMDDLVNIFLYDIIIANNDRHSGNIGFIRKDNTIEVAPIFDNENMLRKSSIEDGKYSFGIERNDILAQIEGNPMNLFHKFIHYSASFYQDRLKEMVEVIRDDNIDQMLKEIENEINEKISEYQKEFIKERFHNNYQNIKSYLKDIEISRGK